MTSPLVEIRNLQVARGGQPVLRINALTIEKGAVLAVVGPNGAGKSSLLLALARLLSPERGEIFFNGNPPASESDLVYRRKVALVLQDPLLFDTSVFDNVAAGLRFRGLGKNKIRPRVEKWLARLGIAELKHRRATELSGGEAQRVSLARALALEPELLLLDEPFSALDPPTRKRLLDDLSALLAETQITTVLVTHDLDEALFLGDGVAVILAGELRQQGTPEAVFTAPSDLDVAAFVGVETVLPGRVVAAKNGQISVEVGAQRIEAVGHAQFDQQVYVCLRPEDVTLWEQADLPPSSARNVIRGHVKQILPSGPLVRVVLDCGFMLVALVTRSSAQTMCLEPGAKVTATFKASAVHIILRSDEPLNVAKID
ncbi:MAG: ABC transporter ATP-binding protein [Chloroflexi bacterium]|nr:ABC transporter ATP-binding protein [Chloroflexota bacterium]